MLMVAFEKPRIYMRRSVWVCRNHHAMGHGYTPAGAYSDWWSQVQAACWGIAA